mgnify:CR=1 FL=1
MNSHFIYVFLMSFRLLAQIYEPEENFYFATSEKCFYQLLEAVDMNNFTLIKQLESSQCVFKYDKSTFDFRMIPLELGNPNKPISLTTPTKFKIIGDLPKGLNKSIIWTRAEFAKKFN